MQPRHGNDPRSDDLHEVLLLCQLPPPIHGLSVVSERVKDILSDAEGFAITHLPIGAASSLGDIGTKNLRKLWAFSWLIVRLLHRAAFRRRADVAYLTFTPWAHTAIRDALLAALGKLLARRTLVHLHTEGLPHLISGQSLRERWVRHLLRSTELIAITEHTAATARESGLFSRVHLLPNMTEDPGPSDKPRSATLRCGYLGNFDPRKGILVFVDVIAALKARGLPVRGVIVGGPSRLLGLQAMNAYVAQHGASEVVEVKGFLAEREKSKFLSDLDVLIYPTRHDHAPLVLLEALAHGTIPITLDTGGIRSLLAPHFCSHVIAADRDFTGAVERIVRRYLARPKQLAFRSAKARALYLQRFSAPVFRDRVLEIFCGAAETEHVRSETPRGRAVSRILLRPPARRTARAPSNSENDISQQESCV